MSGVFRASDEHALELAQPHPNSERMLTTTQVAEHVQLSIPMVRKAIRDGRLEASLPAGSKNGYRIAPSAVECWLEASLVHPEPHR